MGKKKEIVVKAPSKQVIPPEKKAEKTVEKALEEERFGVLRVSRRVGKLFSASIVTAGVLNLIFLTYLILTSNVAGIGYLEKTFWGLVLLVFISLANIVGGLLLVGSE